MFFTKIFFVKAQGVQGSIQCPLVCYPGKPQTSLLLLILRFSKQEFVLFSTYKVANLGSMLHKFPIVAYWEVSPKRWCSKQWVELRPPFVVDSKPVSPEDKMSTQLPMLPHIPQSFYHNSPFSIRWEWSNSTYWLISKLRDLRSHMRHPEKRMKKW